MGFLYNQLIVNYVEWVALPCTNTTTKWWWEWNLVLGKALGFLWKWGIPLTGYFSREHCDMPIRSLGVLLSDGPTFVALGFFSWVELPPARNPWRRLGHVTYLPDHQRQRVLDGIYDSWSQSLGYHVAPRHALVTCFGRPGWHMPCMSTLIQGWWGSWCCTSAWVLEDS